MVLFSLEQKQFIRNASAEKLAFSVDYMLGEGYISYPITQTYELLRVTSFLWQENGTNAKIENHVVIKVRTERKLEKELPKLLILCLLGLTKRDKQPTQEKLKYEEKK